MNDASSPTRIDRRKRHADDPTTPITVNMPDSLRNELDRVIAERGGSRSGFIKIAVTEWLEREEARAREEDSVRGTLSIRDRSH
jgi:metal-responsive CopG/Arc/MetJ family transcriptional regulator